MEKISIVIKTLDRSAVGSTNYLGKTLHNLKRGGVFSSPHLGSIDIVDGGSLNFGRYIQSEVPNIQHKVICSTSMSTLQQNGQRSIQCGAKRAKQAGYQWVMVLEDDVDVCGDFLESIIAWLEDHATPNPNMYVLGASYEQIEQCIQDGMTWWDYPINAFYGAQALVWRTRDAVQLAEWLGPNPSKDGTTDCKHDLLLQDWGRELGLEYFMATAPSLVQHIGIQSGIDNRFFEFRSWPGRDWVYQREAM